MRRVGYMDGLRGLAALQVLGEHYSSAFTGNSWHWARILTASDCAVFLFFLMSGFVLTPSFEKTPNRLILNMQKRVVRLGLPALAALLFALILYVSAPDMAGRSAAITHSHSMIEHTSRLGDVNSWNILADVSGLTLLGGFSETGLIGPLASVMPSVFTSLDPPIWTLHLELWGSALVLLLVWAAAQTRVLYAAVLTASVVLIGINALVLFLIGHLCAQAVRLPLHKRYAETPIVQLLGGVLIALGIAACSDFPLRGMYFAQRILDHGILHSYPWFSWPHELGAILIFVGTLFSPMVHRCLNWPITRWFGRLSFPVYLMHWPILMLVGSSVFLWALHFGHRIAALCALAIGLLITFVLAELFERWCDQPAVALSRNICQPELGSEIKQQPS